MSTAPASNVARASLFIGRVGFPTLDRPVKSLYAWLNVSDTECLGLQLTNGRAHSRATWKQQHFLSRPQRFASLASWRRPHMCLHVSITSGAKRLRTQLTSPGIQENIQELKGILEMFFFKPCNRCKMLLHPIPAPENSWSGGCGNTVGWDHYLTQRF